MFIPRSKQVVESKDKPADDAAKKSQQESEEAMKKLADSLRARAAAGEDFEKLQEEAAAAADFKGKPPTKLGKVRRTSLPPDQAQVFRSEAGRGVTADYHSERISDLQDWRKRHAPAGQGAGRNIFHAALAAHAGDAAEYSGVGDVRN